VQPAAQLNPEQQQAMETTAACTAVIAGPGTGKTKTLVSRIAYLIDQQGISPNEITAVTFTRQAAAEMLERLTAQLGKKAVRGLTVGTFHAICLRLLPKKKLLSREEGDRLLQEVLHAQGSGLPLREAADVVSRERCDVSGEWSALTQAYCEALSAQDARDLDGLLLEALERPVEQPEIFRHLLVDEYQDINAVQRALVRHWAAHSEGLFVIGDPDQSIYGFRGASSACFDDLRRDFQDLRVIRLLKNYRSTPEICNAAMHVIANNGGEARSLEPVLPSGAPVRLMQAESTHSEAVGIAKEIVRMTGGLDMIEAGRMEAAQGELRAFSDIAVLCRTHRQLELIEDCLRKEDIPAEICGRQQWLEDDSVHAALDFLRSRIESELSPRALIEKWCGANGANDAIHRLAEASVLYETVPDLLEALLIGGECDVKRCSGRRIDSGAVRLMTLHGAKGLEFPVVFLAGLNEGAFPPRAESDMAEERRLLFVGMTRAKEELIVSCARPHSEFVSEIAPYALIEKIRPRQPQYQQMSLF